MLVGHYRGHPNVSVFLLPVRRLCCDAQSAAATTWCGWRQGQSTLMHRWPLPSPRTMPWGACHRTPLFFRVFPMKQFPCLCAHCILVLFAVPEMQWSVRRGSSSHHHPQHRHWSLCALHSAFVCSARNAVVSSERVKLTPSSPAQASVTVCIAFCVCLQYQECSGQFREGQAHTIIPSTGIGHCVLCNLCLFAVPEMQWSVQRESCSHHHPQHRHWSLCALQSVSVCSAGNAVVSSEGVMLTPSSPAQALVTVCIAFCVCLQCLKCSSQFSKAQAHTVIPEEGIPRIGSSKDFRSMADIGGEDVGNKVTGWLVGQ